MHGFVYLKDVVTLALDREKCNGCRMCETVCPHGVIQLSQKKASIQNRDACMECGACAKNCRAGAIMVESGVGCANAVISGYFSGGEPVCGCSGEPGQTKSSCC
jgi:ferredoxin